MNTSILILLFAPSFMLICGFVNSMQFDVKPAEPKCFSENIKTSVISVANYFVINPIESQPFPESHKITVRVRSPEGKNHHFGDHVHSGNFAFTAEETGDYKVCFSVADDHKQPVTVIVDFVWRSGVAAKDWSKVAKKGHVEVMELELKKLNDIVSSIHDEIFSLREREIEMQDLNKAINSMMFTFSFASILVCVSVAGLQLWYLKTFFEKKKIL